MLAPETPIFPSADAFAQAFYLEAVRHLEDATLLHAAGRYAAALTSALKAAELGAKSALLLEGGLGWFEVIFKTHKPLTEISEHRFWSQLNRRLDAHSNGLPDRVRGLEQLEPTPFDMRDANATKRREDNTEYPYLVTVPITSQGPYRAELRRPSQVFTSDNSQNGINSAHELLAALATLYPPIQHWGITLPAAV